MTQERCSVEEYLAALLATVAPLGSQVVPLADALGRVLSAGAVALHPVPLFDNSAMDGYAVRTADVERAARAHPARLRVVGTVRAGASNSAAVRAGETLRIMTGAPLPPGADAVIPVESSTAACFDDSAYVDVWPAGGSHIRRRGEDIAAGAPLLDEGHTLGARDIGLLAATGHATVAAHRRPRIAVISTGDELSASPEQRNGTIPDSNSLYLAAAARCIGAVISASLVSADDQHALTGVLDRAAADADLVVSSGGLGAGSHDLVRDTILSPSAGGPGGRWASVDMKPGRPQAYGSWNGVPWIALPGNPTAALVSFETFVRPVLDRLSGRGAVERGEPRVVSAGWSAPSGSLRFVPLSRTAGDGEGAVAPIASPGRSGHSIAAMFGAPLIGVVGADVEHVHPGDLLTVIAPA